MQSNLIAFFNPYNGTGYCALYKFYVVMSLPSHSPGFAARRQCSQRYSLLRLNKCAYAAVSASKCALTGARKWRTFKREISVQLRQFASPDRCVRGVKSLCSFF